MKPIPITAARRLAERVGATRIALVYLDRDAYGITSWGATRADCAAVKAWAESSDGTRAVNCIAAQKRERGIVYTAADPDPRAGPDGLEASDEAVELRRRLDQARRNGRELVRVVATAAEDLAAERVADARELLEATAGIFAEIAAEEGKG